jgi:hypothetical protein
MRTCEFGIIGRERFVDPHETIVHEAVGDVL